MIRRDSLKSVSCEDLLDEIAERATGRQFIPHDARRRGYPCPDTCFGHTPGGFMIQLAVQADGLLTILDDGRLDDRGQLRPYGPGRSTNPGCPGIR
jgi:hypothetical protein